MGENRPPISEIASNEHKRHEKRMKELCVSDSNGSVRVYLWGSKADLEVAINEEVKIFPVTIGVDKRDHTKRVNSAFRIMHVCRKTSFGLVWWLEQQIQTSLSLTQPMRKVKGCWLYS